MTAFATEPTEVLQIRAKRLAAEAAAVALLAVCGYAAAALTARHSAAVPPSFLAPTSTSAGLGAGPYRPEAKSRPRPDEVSRARP
jgi:hypothetical protein